jgi:hypothetical protein
LPGLASLSGRIRRWNYNFFCLFTFNLPEVGFELGKVMPRENYSLEAAQFIVGKTVEHIVLAYALKTVEQTSHIRLPSKGNR